MAWIVFTFSFAPELHAQKPADVDGSDAISQAEATGVVYLPLIFGPPPSLADRVVMVVYDSGNYELFTMNADGGDRVRVTETSSAVINITPAWSPDGSKLMFIARPDATTNLEVYTIDFDGSGLTRITETPNLLEDSPSWAAP